VKLAWLAPAHSIHTVRWANALLAAGHEVHLISFDEFSSMLDPGVHRHPLPFRGRVGRWLNVFSLKKTLKFIEPDLLHSQYVSDYSALGLLTGFHPHIGTAWGADVYEYPYLSRLHMFIVQKVLANLDALTSASVAMAEQMLQILDKKRIIEIIPFGINTEFFAPGADLDQNVFRVGMFKHMEETYGIDRAIRSFSNFHRMHPNSELILAGDGKQIEEYRQLAKSLQIETVVHFVGRMSPQQVAQTLTTLHVVLNLSRYESFGVAIVEALASEVPVIATKVGGVPELVDDGVNGYLVELESPDTKVSDILMYLAQNPAIRKKLGKQGRIKMREHFDVQTGITKMNAMYERMKHEFK
jgi:glycosyltransferase involved in cell wall biosynthesis